MTFFLSILELLDLTTAFDTVDHRIYSIARKIHLAYLAVLLTGSPPIQQAGPSLPLVTTNRAISTSVLGSHKAQSYVHYYSISICCHLIPSYGNTMYLTVHMRMIHSYIFHCLIITSAL